MTDIALRRKHPAIVLIDGNRLAQLMLDYGVGVSVQETIRLLKIDEDYFEKDI